jgi:hypothetical protein
MDYKHAGWGGFEVFCYKRTNLLFYAFKEYRKENFAIAGIFYYNNNQVACKNNRVAGQCSRS